MDALSHNPCEVVKNTSKVMEYPCSVDELSVDMCSERPNVYVSISPRLMMLLVLV